MAVWYSLWPFGIFFTILVRLDQAKSGNPAPGLFPTYVRTAAIFFRKQILSEKRTCQQITPDRLTHHDSSAGRPDEFVKKSPKCSSTHFFLKNNLLSFTVNKSSPIIWATSVIFKRLSKVNNHPIGEKSPNLVTLQLRPHTVSLPLLSTEDTTLRVFWLLIH
jgi:hypothetical protein